MAQNMAKASERVLNGTTRNDIASLSPQARRSYVVLSASPVAPLVVTNGTQYLTFTSASAGGFTIIAAYVNFQTIPVCAGGTSTLAIDRVATDGSTVTSIVAALTVLSGYSANIPVAQTLAATNPTAITAGQSVRVSIVTSNNAVGTADKGGSVTLYIEPVEDNPIQD